MNPQDPLSQLRDIHLPETAGFWPPAPGWWLLSLLLIVLAASAAWWLRRRRQQQRWWHLSRAELRRLEARSQRHPQWFAALNTLLKQAARERYPEAHPETLSGDDWVQFLLSKLPNDAQASQTAVKAIVYSAWQPHADTDPGVALTFAEDWLRRQKC